VAFKLNQEYTGARAVQSKLLDTILVIEKADNLRDVERARARLDAFRAHLPAFRRKTELEERRAETFQRLGVLSDQKVRVDYAPRVQRSGQRTCVPG
jgi:hypothetical protein